MALNKLKMFNSPVYHYTSPIVKESYTITFRYADYDESWYLDIHDSEGKRVKVGIRLKCNSYYNLWGVDPSAYLFVLHKGGAGKDTGLESRHNFDVFVGWEE